MPINVKNLVFPWIVGLCSVSLLAACSFKNLQQTSEDRKPKFKFEQAFTEQCIAKEIRNSVNKDVDRLRFTKPCSCIAKTIMNNLSDREADKFMLEKKITHSLRIKFDKAAYFCVQDKANPKAKALFGKR